MMGIRKTVAAHIVEKHFRDQIGQVSLKEKRRAGHNPLEITTTGTKKVRLT